MKKQEMPSYAAKRFKGKASLVREVHGIPYTGPHALLRATRDFRAWKKVMRKPHSYTYTTIALTIPKGTLFWAHRHASKCRAACAISRGDGCSARLQSFVYRNGEKVTPSRFAEKKYDVCGGGIHFFASKSAAQRYDWS